MINNLLEKINNLDNFSVLAIKIEIILSIGYFITAIICKSTINYSDSVIREVSNIKNLVELGVINFLLSFLFGFIFNLKLKSLKKYS